MAQYIDTDDVDAIVGTKERLALFDDGAGYATSLFNRLAQLASSLVRDAAAGAGYTLGSSTTNDTIKAATLGTFLNSAYNRKGIQPPQSIYDYWTTFQDLKSGAMEISDLTPDAGEAVGGVQFSETTSSISTARYQIFSRNKLDVY